MLFVYDLRFSNPTYNMLYILTRISDVIWKSVEEKLVEEDISLPQFRLLTMLGQHRRPLTPAELSRCVFRESQTITFALNNLKEKGYVEKLSDKKDKRLVRIQISEKGKHLLTKYQKWMATFVSEIRPCFADDEFKQFWASLSKLQERLFYISGIDLIEPLDEFDGRVPMVDARPV